MTQRPPYTAPSFELLPKGWMESVTAHSKQVGEFANSMLARHRQLIAESSRFWESHRQFLKSFEPLQHVFAEIAANQIRDERIEQAGWLPHYTTPLDKIVDATDVSDVGQILAEHYSNEWVLVRRAFEERLHEYDVDDEAKDCFREALDNHEAGRYRSTVRTLFPEIERVVREEILGGKLEGITSLREFREAVRNMPAPALTSQCSSSMCLYRRLVDHLYSPANDPPLVAELEKDAVPNRHAAVHGIVCYKTQQNSMNALIMADFAFLLVSILIALREQDAAEAAHIELETA